MCPFCKGAVERSAGCNFMYCKPPGKKSKLIIKGDAVKIFVMFAHNLGSLLIMIILNAISKILKMNFYSTIFKILYNQEEYLIRSHKKLINNKMKNFKNFKQLMIS